MDSIKELKIHKLQSNKLLILALFLLLAISIPPEKSYACTSVCLVKNGHVVFGNNLDWYIVEGMVVINKRNVKKRGLWFNSPPVWTSKYASVTVNQEGREFPSRGMNEAGLVIGEMTLSSTDYPDRDSRYAVNTLQWIQYQLDNCSTIDEVIATDKIIRIDKDEYHSHFFVCDSFGNCATIEWINGKLQAHSKEEVPIKVLANYPYDYCITHGNDPSGRFGKAAKMLHDYQSGNPVEYVFSILQNVSQPHTKWSLVFDSKKRIMYYKTALSRELKYISLCDFDLNCVSNVFVSDINSSGNGNMYNIFIPYSEKFNADIIRTVFKQYVAQFGKTPEEHLLKIIKYPETTTCNNYGMIKDYNYILDQNYPNPFNPVTTIGYYLPKNSTFNLILYDILGREIFTLFNGEKPFGYHAVKLDASSLTSGVYLYRLQVDNTSLQKKMVLIR
ncbi:MAG: linear amide C-N hydrolase [bacterium]